MLLERGADVSAWTRTKSGHLHYYLALQYGGVEVARMLLEHGADVIGPEQGRGDAITPGIAMTEQVEVALACFLSAARDRVGPERGQWHTPLHLASQQGTS
jgi:hypothetical protein